MTATATPMPQYVHLRYNFVLFVLDYVAFGVGFGMVGASSAFIPDFVSQLTSNQSVVGLATGAYFFWWLVPQLFLAQVVNRQQRRKLFLLPAPFVRLTMIAIAIMLVTIDPSNKTTMLIAFLIGYWAFAVGDSIITLSWGDMLGSAIPSKLRGTLFGIGQFMVAIGAFGMSQFARWAIGDSGLAFPLNYGLVFAVAGAFFISGGIGLALIREEKPVPVSEKSPRMREYGAFLGNILRTDRDFRRFVRTRLLFDLAAMSVPFYTIFATSGLGIRSAVLIADTIILIQLGNALGALTMSVLSRRFGSKAVILLAGTCITLEATFALISFLGAGQPALYTTFFLMGMVSATIFPSYFDWMITHAPPHARPIYIGLMNTISALSNLAPVLGGVLLQLTSRTALPNLLAIMPDFLPMPEVTVRVYPVVFISSMVLASLGWLSALRLSEPRKRTG
ncbi:MAG: MFS transporter [Chloroflexi bacterium CFX4]|nr:MFS transporter [Chloroflexi bacterium CFX4]MDL1921597.1 MFS transporter [Chloroflexi bacterium CFX3]